MSDNIYPRLYNGRALNQQWLNLIHQSHDLFCGCPKPLEHLHHILPKEICHSTTSTTTTSTNDGDDGDDFHLSAGDLERLFDVEKEDKER